MFENLKIGFLMHFYQPWWQKKEVLKRIVDECYRPVLEAVAGFSGFCFSANVNYSLLELLDGDFPDVIDDFVAAVVNSKIELLGSTAYHPIMPLIPKEVQIHQMLVDSELKKACWGISENCGGIYLPEMAYSRNILVNLASFGYSWTVLDDMPFLAQYNYAPSDHIVSTRGFRLYLRSNYWSNRITGGGFDFNEIREKMNYEIPLWTKNQPAYLILAMDAETFGHHHPELIGSFLEPMLEKWGSGGSNILMPIERLGDGFAEKALVTVHDSSWSTSESDYWRDDPFPLWNSRDNPHHKIFWQLINIALRYFHEKEVKLDCLKITSSCHLWWISGRPFWRPEFMRLGAEKAFEIVKRYGCAEEIEEAENIFKKLNALK